MSKRQKRKIAKKKKRAIKQAKAKKKVGKKIKAPRVKTPKPTPVVIPSDVQPIVDAARPIKLFEMGVLVQINISFWSMRAMMTRDEYKRVGLDPEKLPKEIVNLGRKLLVPKEVADDFMSLEHAARHWLRTWSVEFGISNTYFVPFTKLKEVVDRLREYKEEFQGMVDDMVKRFPEYKKAMKDKWGDFYTQCLQGAYPDQASLRSRYRFQWVVFQIGSATLAESSSEEALARSKEMRDQLQERAQEFVEEYVVTMRREIQKFCGMMKARMNGEPFEDEEGAKRMTARTITALQRYIDQFRQMNIFGDNEVQKLLEDFSTAYLRNATGKEDFEDPKLLASANEALAAISEKAATEGELLSKFTKTVKRRVVIS